MPTPHLDENISLMRAGGRLMSLHERHIHSGPEHDEAVRQRDEALAALRAAVDTKGEASEG